MFHQRFLFVTKLAWTCNINFSTLLISPKSVLLDEFLQIDNNHIMQINPRGGGANLLFSNIFAKDRMQMKEMGLRERGTHS